jgi:hypothetical protein
MGTTVRLTPQSEALLQKQLASGTYGSPEEVIERALITLAMSIGESAPAPSGKSPAEAVASIRENRKGITLGGLKLKDLIREGQKY